MCDRAPQPRALPWQWFLRLHLRGMMQLGLISISLFWAGFFEYHAGQRLGFSSIVSPDTVTTMVSTPSKMEYMG